MFILHKKISDYFIMFVPGNNPEQSLANFYTWLNAVYDSHGLPCNCKIKSSDDTFFYKRCVSPHDRGGSRPLFESAW